MNERDKFLTEAMGECWHEGNDKITPYICGKCGLFQGYVNVKEHRINFSTWEGFGKLWEWAQQQEWWFYFQKGKMKSGHFPDFIRACELIHPDRFADALYSFLKERKP